MSCPRPRGGRGARKLPRVVDATQIIWQFGLPRHVLQPCLSWRPEKVWSSDAIFKHAREKVLLFVPMWRFLFFGVLEGGNLDFFLSWEKKKYCFLAPVRVFFLFFDIVTFFFFSFVRPCRDNKIDISSPRLKTWKLQNFAIFNLLFKTLKTSTISKAWRNTASKTPP